jgi:hypothetical protein
MAIDGRKISPVARDKWPQTVTTFNSMNKGRKIKIERYGGGKTHEHMEKDVPLFSLTYNAPSKGDSLVIAVGRDRAENEYKVEAPEELWVESDIHEKGPVMEIIDKDGRHVTISLE